MGENRKLVKKCDERERVCRWGEELYCVRLKEKEITTRWHLLGCYELCPTLLLSLLYVVRVNSLRIIQL
jgi:hypothetical protein